MKRRTVRLFALTMIKILEGLEEICLKLKRSLRRTKVWMTSVSIVCISIFAINVFTDVNQIDTEYVSYVVESGDTLYDISQRYYNGDPRQAVSLIQSINKINATIHPGQIIQVPSNK
ncbi:MULTISPECIES: LysM peptidoglycan-binding domain-containing protein [Paenibacillus]|uniref:LysM peptidoglycan-binding domain-containing protein n=1 Tax=Paenibacillus vandeheii TaxID=3035917 RepID=A0ABT8JFJ9_9BACL|nr:MULTISPECIES: LysM peptidoglycan-binding domain-containing protein [Paenibacillus]KGP81964.1 hypothetical protein P364_0114170 [Paenibacillus sp. MAEPY2]KGP86050.1 hypothetical protein P363_0119645 [Paenibacillus sp. MAEPY1]MDN4603879.1 LysM peptidoglycan-binding domain-containing protein [Paenibacillus vandeheii]